MSLSRTTKVLALSLGNGLTALVTLVSGMVLARVLSKTDLATYRQTLLAYDVALPLLSLGLASGLYYFLPTEKERPRGVLVEGLLLMAGMGLVYAVFIALGGNHLLARRFSNPAIIPTLAFLVPLPILMLPAKLLPPVLVTQNRVQTLTVYNVLTALVLAAGVIGACVVWRSPSAMVLTRVGLSIGAGLLAIGLMLRAVPGGDWRPSGRHLKQMVIYSLPLAGAASLGAIHIQMDKLIVSSMCGPEDFAVYSNGAFQIPLIGILTGSIAAVIQPDLRRMVVEGNLAGALALFRQSALKSAALLFPAMFFLLICAEPLILTLFTEAYAGSVMPFRLYLLILPVRIIQFGSFMIVLGLNRVMLYRALAGLSANLVLSVVLVRQMGYLGAALSTVVCLYSVNCVLNFRAIGRAVGCGATAVLPFGALLRLGGYSLLASLPVGLMQAVFRPEWAPAWRLLLDSVVFAVSMVGVVWAFDVQAYKQEWRRLGRRFWSRLRPAGEGTA